MSTPFPMSPADARIAARQDAAEIESLAQLPVCWTRCASCDQLTRTMIQVAHIPTLCTDCIVDKLSSHQITSDTECDRCGAKATRVEVLDQASHYEMLNVCNECIGEDQ